MLVTWNSFYTVIHFVHAITKKWFCKKVCSNEDRIFLGTFRIMSDFTNTTTSITSNNNVFAQSFHAHNAPKQDVKFFSQTRWKKYFLLEIHFLFCEIQSTEMLNDICNFVIVNEIVTWKDNHEGIRNSTLKFEFLLEDKSRQEKYDEWHVCILLLFSQLQIINLLKRRYNFSKHNFEMKQ